MTTCQQWCDGDLRHYRCHLIWQNALQNAGVPIISDAPMPESASFGNRELANASGA